LGLFVSFVIVVVVVVGGSSAQWLFPECSSSSSRRYWLFTFSRRLYPKQLTYVRFTMYTHFTFTAHCTSGAIRGSASCSRTLRQGIELAGNCWVALAVMVDA